PQRRRPQRREAADLAEQGVMLARHGSPSAMRRRSGRSHREFAPHVHSGADRGSAARKPDGTGSAAFPGQDWPSPAAWRVAGYRWLRSAVPERRARPPEYDRPAGTSATGGISPRSAPATAGRDASPPARG